MSRVLRWAIGHPVDLAVFRITVSTVILLSEDVWQAHRWVGAAIAPPLGWSWVPFPTETAARLMTVLVVAAALMTLIGFFTRVSSVLLAIGLAWLLGVPQFSGQVMHTHHLVWFAALMAAGPSGDAWSIDARRNPKPLNPSLAHGLPIRFAWLIIGLIFLFPGMWKLIDARPWLDQLPALISWKRFQLGLSPFTSSLINLGGIVAIALEVSLWALLLFRRTRLLGALAALTFHLGVQWVMGIGFSSLWACYLVFGDWARWQKRTEAPVEGWKRTTPALIIGTSLVLGMIFTGTRDLEQSWPIASYPSFRHPPPTEIRWVEITEGHVVVFGLPQLRANQRWWGLAAKVAANPTPEALKRFHEQVHATNQLHSATYKVVQR